MIQLYQSLRQAGSRYDDPRLRYGNVEEGCGVQQVTAVGSSIVDPAIGTVGDVDTVAVTPHFGDGRPAVITKNSHRAVYGSDQ